MLPFNAYSQLKLSGNEFATDQVFNRVINRLFRNDDYLDKQLSSHVNNDLIHSIVYEDNKDESKIYNDRVVVLPFFKDGTSTPAIDDVTDPSSSTGGYTTKSWQRLIEEQPKDLGGNTLVFRFQQDKQTENNPASVVALAIRDILQFEDFYGGTLIIESPAAYSSGSNYQTKNSAVNQHLKICGSGQTQSIIKVINCKCKVIIRNCFFAFPGNFGYETTTTWDDKESSLENNKMYKNTSSYTPEGAVSAISDNQGFKRYSAIYDKWYNANMISAIQLVDSDDVTIHHCYIQY